MEDFVFSAHAEVVHMGTIEWLFDGCILRARGGSSLVLTPMGIFTVYSPRTRR